MQQSINELQRAHAASVDRLADRCRERDEEGARQRKQLEQHYEALLTEMNSRTRVCTTMFVKPVLATSQFFFVFDYITSCDDGKDKYRF